MNEVPFGVWLGRQGERDDRVGDLARDYLHGGWYPSQLKEVKRHLELAHASPQAWGAFDQAVEEWTQA